MTDVTRLLALSNGAALHKALRGLGVGVSYRTVARWVGENPSSKPPADLMPVIEAAFGLRQTEEAAPPSWAERLLARVDEIYEAQMAIADSASRRVIEALAPDELREAAAEADARLAAELEQSRRNTESQPGDRAGGPVGESPGSKRRSQ